MPTVPAKSAILKPVWVRNNFKYFYSILKISIKRYSKERQNIVLIILLDRKGLWPLAENHLMVTFSQDDILLVFLKALTIHKKICIPRMH
jgi:hypothetical protein